MRQRTRLIVNALANMFARLVTVASRLVIVPFAIAFVGRSHYGTWIIVGQILAYSRIFELGIRSAVARQVAMRLPRGDHDALRRYVNTAACHYSVAGLIIALMTVGVAIFFPTWFHVEPPYHTASRVMVLCAGFTLALSVAQYAYGAVLGGLQRFDIVSGTQVGADLLHMIVILTLLRRFEVGGALIFLALAAGGSTLLAVTVRTFTALRLCPYLRFEPWRPDRAIWRSMATFGVNTVVYMMSALVAAQLAPIVIGAMKGTAEATDFRLAMEMIIAIHAFVIACTIGIRPAASRYDGEDDQRMLRHLLVRSTRYTALVSLFGLVILILFPETFLRLWQGHNYPGTAGAETLGRIATSCRILALGFGPFWLLLPAFNVVNGMGRHRFPAAAATMSGLASMGLVVLVAFTGSAEITRFAWGISLPMIPVWGVAIVAYCSRQIGERISTYIWQGLIVPVLAWLPTVLLGFVLNHWFPASTWWAFIAQLGCCGVTLVVSSWLFVLAPDDRTELVGAMTKLYHRLR